MSKRLQVLLADREMFEIQRLAMREGLTLGEWVPAYSNTPEVPDRSRHPHQTDAQLILERLVAGDGVSPPALKCCGKAGAICPHSK